MPPPPPLPPRHPVAVAETSGRLLLAKAGDKMASSLDTLASKWARLLTLFLSMWIGFHTSPILPLQDDILGGPPLCQPAQHV